MQDPEGERDCAGNQPLTRKLSEAALGLSGKERSAFLEAPPPMAQDDNFDTSAMQTHSGMSSGRTDIHRPQVTRKPCESDLCEELSQGDNEDLYSSICE